MSLIVLFGLPGSGKTFAGKLLQKHTNYYFFEGDNALPPSMKDAIAQHVPITEEMRDTFFANILSSLEILSKTHTNIVLSQTFIKEKYRDWIREKFPEVTFILVETTTSIREDRLLKRHDYPLDLEYSRHMVRAFETPRLPVSRVKNDASGEREILHQLRPFVYS